ncbi:MAG: HMG-box domain-containing protein [archaeon]|nr:HMG-box domain-containing protein [archaeon]
MGKTAKKEKKERVKHQHKKDKNAPKRAISAFFFYNQERRPILKKEKPSLSNTEIISEMSKEWKALPEAKKKPYITKAENDKKRYEKEMEAYRKKNPAKKGKKE